MVRTWAIDVFPGTNVKGCVESGEGGSRGCMSTVPGGMYGLFPYSATKHDRKDSNKKRYCPLECRGKSKKAVPLATF